MVQGPWGKDGAHRETPGASIAVAWSERLSIYFITVSRIMHVCLHTATCLNTPLMRLLTSGFLTLVPVFWCATLSRQWMGEDRCLAVFLCVFAGLTRKWKEMDLLCPCLFPYTQVNYTTVTGKRWKKLLEPPHYLKIPNKILNKDVSSGYMCKISDRIR